MRPPFGRSGFLACCRLPAHSQSETRAKHTFVAIDYSRKFTSERLRFLLSSCCLSVCKKISKMKYGAPGNLFLTLPPLLHKTKALRECIEKRDAGVLQHPNRRYASVDLKRNTAVSSCVGAPGGETWRSIPTIPDLWPETTAIPFLRAGRRECKHFDSCSMPNRVYSVYPRAERVAGILQGGGRQQRHGHGAHLHL